MCQNEWRTWAHVDTFYAGLARFRCSAQSEVLADSAHGFFEVGDEGFA